MREPPPPFPAEDQVATLAFSRTPLWHLASHVPAPLRGSARARRAEGAPLMGRTAIPRHRVRAHEEADQRLYKPGSDPEEPLPHVRLHDPGREGFS